MQRHFLLVLSLSFATYGSNLFGCSGNEYWQDDPKGVPVWTVRYEVEIDRSDVPITDNFLRNALARAGLKPCSSVEKDLIDADVKKAVRTDSIAVSKQLGWSNYDEITQVMVRHRVRPQARAIVEVLTRTKIRRSRNGRFMPAPLEYQQDAAKLANRIADDVKAICRDNRWRVLLPQNTQTPICWPRT